MPYFNDTCNILSNIHGVNEWPYPWAHTTTCLPWEIYDELADERPPWQAIAQDKIEANNKRVDIAAFALLQSKTLHPIWLDFIRYHTSHAFYHKILDTFEDRFAEYYPHLNLRKYKTAVRYSKEDADIYLDCQLSINTPVKQKSTVSKPHVDNPLELWASLLYMTDPADRAGGDLVIHKCRDFPSIIGKRDVEEKNLMHHCTLPYYANSMACFVNTPFSVHSVTERDVTDMPRLMVNISLEFMKPEDQLFVTKRMT